MTILLLGGTSEAQTLARALQQQSLSIIYSIAGKVRHPHLECPIISGGFTQYGGMQQYVQMHHISHIIDATHPYAQYISQQAVDTATQCCIPYWRLTRTPWEKQSKDHWITLKQIEDLSQLITNNHTNQHHPIDKNIIHSDYSNILLTIGQLSEAVIEMLHHNRTNKQQFYYRSMIPPRTPLPSWLHWHKAAFRFPLEDEIHCLKQYAIDLIVSKNSGGLLTYNKIIAAQQLHIPIAMIQRPLLAPSEQEFFSIEALVNAIVHPS